MAARTPYAWLTVNSGPSTGANYLLDPWSVTTMGRGNDCTVIVNDALCSRIHARLARADGLWQVADESSRNGTFVNGQKIDRASLGEGHLLQIGGAEFRFHQADQPPEKWLGIGGTTNHSLVRETRVDRAGEEPGGAPQPAAGDADADSARDLLKLYRLSTRLAGCLSPADCLQSLLELLRNWTGGTLAGFQSLAEDGRLKPALLFPQSAPDAVMIGEPMTRLLCEEGHAVWVASQPADAGSQGRQSDALCVPLIHCGKALGVAFVQVERGLLRESQFELAIAACTAAAPAVARAYAWQAAWHGVRWMEADRPPQTIVGECSQMRELVAECSRRAQLPECVLLRGEGGTGKKLLALEMHRQSPRADRPLMLFRCSGRETPPASGPSAGPLDERGLASAAGCAILLEEVSGLSPPEQAQLAKVLSAQAPDVRIYATTSDTGLPMPAEGAPFSAILSAELAQCELRVPPLRDRGRDIELLLRHFVDWYAVRHRRRGLAISLEALQAAQAYAWPGNVRQLANAAENAVLRAGERIEPPDLHAIAPLSPNYTSLRVDEWERKLIAEALGRSNGNVPRAAELLGLGRATLYRKLAEYGNPGTPGLEGVVLHESP